MRSNRYKSVFNGERIRLFSRSLIGFSFVKATFYNIICIFARKLQKLKFKEKDYG